MNPELIRVYRILVYPITREAEIDLIRYTQGMGAKIDYITDTREHPDDKFQSAIYHSRLTHSQATMLLLKFGTIKITELI